MELWIQLDMLARGSDFDQWGDILVIVVMALLWLGGGLAKVLATKRGAQQHQPPRQDKDAAPQRGRRDTWQERLIRKAQEIQRAAEAKARQFEQQVQSQTSAKTPSRRQAPPQPPAGKIAIRHGPTGDSVMVYERPASPTATERPRPAARLRQPKGTILAGSQATATAPIQSPAMARETPQPLESGTMSAPPPAEPTGFRPDDLVDYRDPDALMKAVLHYEILGKPLALRQASDEAMGF